jgi:hypothetical protein
MAKSRETIVLMVFIVLLVALLVVPRMGQGPSTRGWALGGQSSISGTPAGNGLADRQVLGLFSESFADNLKTKYPKSEWSSVRNVRMFVRWRNVEPEKGKFDWAALDSEINAALSLGINSILLTISGPTPPFATNKANPGDPQLGPPKNIKDWGDFCAAIAKRYKGYVDYYQIWNEPGWDIDAPPAKNGLVYFSGQADYQYMGILRSAYNAIKVVNPDAYVASGSLMNGLTREPTSFVNYDTLMAGRNQDISMKVESAGNIVAERPMYFDYHGAWTGGTDELGVKAPRNTWYLAEGATHPGFEEWISIQNPGDINADVTITYMFPGGGTQKQAVTVGPHSRSTVDVNTAVGPYKDVSARVSSPRQPIVVERPMYFNYQNKWDGGSIESGVAEPSKTWYLAEGTTQSGFDEWISLMNPGATAAKVNVTYMFQGGQTQKQEKILPPTSRETILVNKVVGPNRDVSAKVEASSPIIAERPMYFNYHGVWTGGDTQVGATAPATDWFFAEGTTRNNKYDGQFDEWISIQNPGDIDTNVEFTYMFPGGGTKKAARVVPAHARETVNVNQAVGENQDVSVRVSSKQPIVAERPMYFNYHNAWTGGTVVLGCQQSGKTWYFAEGTTRQGFDEWLTLQNPGGAAASATITFMFGDGSTQKKTVVLPPNSRTTVGVNQSVSMGTICDGVAFHPYDYPQWWSWYYRQIVDICDKYGYRHEDVISSEIGWPNGTNSAFSVEGQRQAIGELGVGQLLAAGCRKIWIFEDIDRPPGSSPNQDYYGLFNYYGKPYPSWNEYKNWQSKLPDYGNRPTKLTIKKSSGKSR